MKRIFIAVLIAFSLFTSAGASDQWTLLEGASPNLTLLSAVTSTGAGSAVDIGYIAKSMTCDVAWGGTAPTNVVVNLWGSRDNVRWASASGANYLTQVTVTSSPWQFHVTNKPVRYLKGEYVSKSAGDGTTSVTLECSAIKE